MSSRALGRNGPTVFPLALGCMGMSGMYGPSDEAESIATIHAAIGRGVTLIDTGDFYSSSRSRSSSWRCQNARSRFANLFMPSPSRAQSPAPVAANGPFPQPELCGRDPSDCNTSRGVCYPIGPTPRR